MNKNIFIYAYTNLNLGDDLFIKILCDRYPNNNFLIQAPKSKSFAFESIPNLKVIPTIRFVDSIFARININFSVNSILKRKFVKKCDIIVNIGGSIFIEPEKWYRKTAEFEKVLRLNKPLFVIGSNFGPYESQEYFNEYKKLFSKTKDICFRDKYSYDLFSEEKNVRKAADVVFTYEPVERNISSNNIIISVIQLSNRQNLKKFKEDYINHILDLISSYSEQGNTITLMGFCESEGDEAAIDEIISRINNHTQKYLRKYIYKGDLKESLELIQDSKYILGSRFHAMILAWVFDKPVYPIIYSNKSTNVIKDVNFQGYFSEITDLNKIDMNIIMESLSEDYSIDIEKQRKSSLDQFLKLDEYMTYIGGEL